ncbi:phosphate ABC transporter substrate-binding protein [Anaerovorax odorimutans]|uniref:Phosphate-binding protein n=1 Tax=Anaerovorax odorimutans TaxID=109327 RepID=A0ABT1RKD6_9FIRM|nr:phosphate ABC transporter substrate-binding protein [Anaerovorax odorimutans]MCQ4635633.1 phosphate ABC transporter substrate-binding protein [Anaerovorax odorimutans]
MKKKLLTGLLAAAVLVTSLGMAGCGSGGDSKDAAADKGSVVIAGSTSVQPLSEAVAEAYMDSNPDVTVEVQGGGSGQGIKSIEEKIADIGALSREVKDEEKASVADEYVVAKDGVAVVVNKDVKVNDLTLEQIKDIYTGKIANWKEVGGDDKPITVVSREEGSGTRGAFTEITGVLEKDDAGKETDKTTKDALVQPSTGAVKKTVGSTPDSIGYVSLGALDDSVKTVKVEGIEATVDNVLSGDYKIQRPFVYVVNSEMSDTAKAFIEYATGAEGQKIVEENGFIPVN